MKYFDKDFFKFLLGFTLIIVVSIALIIVVRGYGANSEQDPVTNIATP